MTENITEQELRQDVLESRLLPTTNARCERIYRLVKEIAESGSVFFVLTDTPEQSSDVLRILVDDKSVVAFELDRQNLEALPMDVRTYSVHDYRKAIGTGLAEAELRIAIELAQEELNRNN